jgi:Domain of unknown function (DUF1737)
MIKETIIEYGIAAGDHYKELAEQVNKAIKKGFQPTGNVFEARFGEQVLLHQPMVKYGIEKKKVK